MFCILVTGPPAVGKSSLTTYLSDRMQIPCISKDKIKEILFDSIGFNSRDEKIKLNKAANELLLSDMEMLMKGKQSFIVDNNFEKIHENQLRNVFFSYQYSVITITLLGEKKAIFKRYCTRNLSEDRHLGHVLNDKYPEEQVDRTKIVVDYDSFLKEISIRGMESFDIGEPHLYYDTTQIDITIWETILFDIFNYLKENNLYTMEEK